MAVAISRRMPGRLIPPVLSGSAVSGWAAGSSTTNGVATASGTTSGTTRQLRNIGGMGIGEIGLVERIDSSTRDGAQSVDSDAACARGSASAEPGKAS